MQPVRIPRLELTKSGLKLKPSPPVRPRLMEHLTGLGTARLRKWVNQPTLNPHQKRIALIPLSGLSTEERNLVHQSDFLASLRTKLNCAISKSGLTNQYRLSGLLDVATNGENYGLSEPSEHPGDFVFGTIIDHTDDQYR